MMSRINIFNRYYNLKNFSNKTKYFDLLLNKIYE